ncbi:MAG: hypothetical protein GY737_19150 [Desulfobacteraceae bacterium]|nr:hypothetical protein [Desulfobacteraceae bacterium]
MKCFVRITMLMVLLSLPVYADASPVYLTLQGTVDSIHGSAGLETQANVAIGDTLTYVLMVDPELQGSSTSPGCTQPDGKPGYIFTSLYKGVLDGKRKYKYNWGNLFGNIAMQFKAGNEKSFIYMLEGSSFENITVGTKISQFYEQSWLDTFSVEGTMLNFKDTVVTRIDNTVPTPVPGAVMLLGGGLGALGILRRKFGKSSSLS